MIQHPDKVGGRIGNRLFQLAYLIAQTKKGKIPDIYVQDPMFFKDAIREIKASFGESNFSLPHVAIHVRRGDYVNNPFYVDLTKTNYYQKAIEEFEPEKNFMIFSDDPEFCKTLPWVKSGKFHVMDRGDELADLNLMSSCESQIIANSSFSWWAAFLNTNPNKKVIAPIAWYSDGFERTKCPKEWKRL